MRQVRLINLKLKNFKNIKKFELKIDGESVSVMGQNATGKTTLIDAWLWLLTGTDSNQRAKFNIITTDSTGDEITGQEATVVAHIEVDGSPLVISRTLSQKWTKKRGQADTEFTGHDTKFEWNQVEIKKKEFDSRVSEILSHEKIRMISDVHYFCGVMKWNDRRQVLIDLLGNVDDDKIIEDNPDLEPLKKLLSDKSPEDLKKYLSSLKKSSDKKLKELPIRIDALKRSLPDVSDVDEGPLVNDLTGVERQIDSKKDELLKLGTGLDVTEKQKELTRLDIEIQNLESEINRKCQAEIQRIESEINKLKNDNSDRNRAISDEKNQISIIQKQIKDNEDQRLRLYEDFKKIKYKKYKPADVCFACGRSLNGNFVERQKEEFNLKLAEEKRGINESGQRLKSELEGLEHAMLSRRKTIDVLETDVESTETKIDMLKKQIHKTNNECQLVMDQKTAPLYDQVATLSKEIEDSENENNPTRDRIESEIKRLNSTKTELEGQLRLFDRIRDLDPQIKGLQSDLRQTAYEYETVESQLFLLEQFSACRSKYIEETVSDKFIMCDWKLFDLQINQGIREVCEAMVGGVQYSTNLNTGARINAGIDCVSVLSDHFGVQFPLFIDNAESISSWMDYKGQLIKLVVSPDDKKLKINQG